MPRKRLLASDLVAPFHGIRSSGLDRRIALAAAMSSCEAYSGPTAAAIWGLPLPSRWEEDERLSVTSTGPNRMRRPGVVASRRPDVAIVRIGGLPVLDPVATWLSLGGLLVPWDLTAIADRLVSGTLTTPALSSMDELGARLAAAGRFPGVGDLRFALDDARPGSWSRPETLLRLLILRAGLPELVLNAPVALEDRRIAHPDPAWPQFRIAIEYDGRWHDSAGRREADVDRHERLVDVGWIVVRVRAPDLFGRPSAVVARLIRRLRDRGAEVSAVHWSRMPPFEP